MSEILPIPIVLDASVLVKWYLPGENGVAEALTFRDEFLATKIEIILPDLARYELASAINVARRRGRINADDARQAIADFLSWDFTYVGTDDLIRAAADTALRLDCTVYDALYLALASSMGAGLVTADNALFLRSHPTEPWVTLLGSPTP